MDMPPGWPSTSVNDDLTLTAFYFKQEDTVSLLISLTVCSIAQELSDSMRTAIEERFGISKNACIIHAIHTHSGPNLAGSIGWGDLDTLEAETGAVTAFINGAEGDIGPRLTNGLTVGEGDIRYAMRLGAVAGQDAVRIYNQPRIYVTPELRVSYRRITIPYSKRIPLAEANEQYKKFRGETINVLGKQKAYYKSIIESYENGYEDEYGYDVNQTILRLGDVAIVTTPFEPFAEIALRISKHSKLPYTLLLSNANGHSTYFPTEDDLCRGGYEVVMFLTGQLQAPLPNADWYFITQTVEHLNSI